MLVRSSAYSIAQIVALPTSDTSMAMPVSQLTQQLTLQYYLALPPSSV